MRPEVGCSCAQVSSNFLDRIRTLKARMVRLKTKVETVRPQICTSASVEYV